MDMMSKQLDFLTSKFGYMETEPTGLESEEVNYVHQGSNNQNFNNNYRYNQGGGNFNNFGNRAHPNLSYGNPHSALQPPPGFQVSNGQIIEPKKNELGDVLMTFMKQTWEIMANSDKRLKQVETDVQSLSIHMKSIDTQMSQISQAVGIQYQPGQFPSHTIVNPKDCKDCKAICATIQPERVEKEVDEETAEDTVVKEEEKQPEPPRLEPYTPKIPFPSRIKKKVVDEKFEKLLDIFRKVNVNIPLVEALQQMPMYAKFLKDVISKKKKWVDYETVSMSENCSAIIQKKLPAKLKDPGSFNISCVIGDDKHTKALCDLGASINLMPLSFFRKMKIGTLKPTRITLQMADRSVTYPEGIIEDVLVRVNDFIFPVDFVVLDMEEDRNVPLILGRPFLATGKALIDVSRGELTLRMGTKHHILSIYKAMGSPKVEELAMKKECKVVNVVQVQKGQRVKPKVENISLPQCLFGPCGGSTHCKGRQREPKKTKEEESGISITTKLELKSNDNLVKKTWWKKRLARMYQLEHEEEANIPINGEVK
ncbi:uncharacterized protein LOC125220524 [Salvia hispanica]|uniref:uncharacterized protein LOC125220524 n=1 Tax=Salvia hispanica TaxID=49212 RepID=UPI002009C794|nr:uncharacterized protein LOC125220524 [Salvia hispanica]